MPAVIRLCCAIALLLGRPALAEAHGPPETLSVTVGPEASDLLVGLSFGVLFSRDRGETWSWLCEAAVGYSDFDIVPRWLWLDNGRMVATTTDGLSVSTDRCAWTKAEGTAGYYAGDVQGHPTEPETVLASLSNREEGTTSIVRSTDGAATFPEELYSAAGRSVSTVRFAPSDPQQIYGGAFSSSGDLAWVLHSTDGGESWTERTFNAPVRFFRVLGVDPADPATIYAASHAPDAVHRSTDSGATFEQVLPGLPLGFLIEDAGATVWVSIADDGLYLSEDGGETFSPVEGAPSSGCITRNGEDLYLCGIPPEGEAALTVTADGTDFEVMMADFDEMDGAVECPAESTAASSPICAPFFNDLVCSFKECENGRGSGSCNVAGDAPRGGAAVLALLALLGSALLFSRRAT